MKQWNLPLRIWNLGILEWNKLISSICNMFDTFLESGSPQKLNGTKESAPKNLESWICWILKSWNLEILYSYNLEIKQIYCNYLQYVWYLFGIRKVKGIEWTNGIPPRHLESWNQKILELNKLITSTCNMCNTFLEWGRLKECNNGIPLWIWNLGVLILES